MPELPDAVALVGEPDGRSRIELRNFPPVILSAALCAVLTEYQRWVLVRRLAVHATLFCTLRRLPIPWTTGRFVQCGEEFFLEDESAPGCFADFRAPQRSVIAGN